MLTWKSRAPSLPIAVDMHTPATTQGMSPSSPALRFSPISVSGSLPKMRSGLSIGIGMERPLGRVSLGGPSMGGWSPGVGSPTGGSVGSSRLPSQSGAAPAGAAGSSSVVDGAPPWAAGRGSHACLWAEHTCMHACCIGRETLQLACSRACMSCPWHALRYTTPVHCQLLDTTAAMPSQRAKP